MNKTFSALGGLLVILVAVVFIVQFRPATGGGGPASGPTCAIEIQGGCISSQHYNTAYRLIGGGFEASYLRSMGVRRAVADGLIERWLLNQDAARLGISVSDEDITAELAKGRAYVSLPSDKARDLGRSLGLLSQGGQGRIVWETPMRLLPVKNPKTKAFDLKTYEQTIRNIAKMSPSDFREFQREEIIAARMRDLIRSRVHVADAEGYDDYSRRKSTTTLEHVTLDRNFFADLFVDQSQKAIDEWAAKNTEEINKTYDATKAQYGDECRVASHILAKVTDDATDEEKAKAQKRIDRARELLEKGEDFADVARRFSEDTSATKGGELGCIPRKRTVPEFEKALFELEEGKTSGIVKSQFGHHIIKLEKIAKGDGMEKVLKDLLARDLYLKHSAETMAAEGAKKIHAAVKGGKPLGDALTAYLAELAATQPKAADAKGAKDGDEKEGDKPADEVVENKPFTTENHPDRPLVQTTAPFNVSGNPLPSAMSSTDLVKEAFKLEKPGDTTNDIVPLRNGYAVVALKEKAGVKKEDWEKDRDETLAAIRKNKQAEALTQYVQRLRSKAIAETPIKENQAIVSPPEEKGDAPPVEDEGGEP